MPVTGRLHIIKHTWISKCKHRHAYLTSKKKKSLDLLFEVAKVETGCTQYDMTKRKRSKAQSDRDQ